MAPLFWPQKNGGGPPISLLNLVSSIQDQFDIYIISKNHELHDDRPLDGIQPGWNQLRFGRAYYTLKGQHTLRHITSLIEEVRPDVIYQNSFFSVDDLFPVLLYKRRHPQVKVIVAPRGELYPQRIRHGWLKKEAYIQAFRLSGLLKDVYFQGTGEDECLQEQALLGIPARRTLNIQNISITASLDMDRLAKRPHELRLAYIARIHPAKNTLNAIQWLKSVSGSIQYDLYGPIEDQAFWCQCQKAVAELPKNITVRYMGAIEHDQVPVVLAKYHALYMPTTGENFGHSIVEAMLLGKPVIISDQTPWTDVNGNGGYAVGLLDKEGFITALNGLSVMSEDEYLVMCRQVETYIRKKINVNEIVNQYIAAFNGE